MIIKNSIPVVYENNPFKNDKLNREFIADNLNTFLKSTTDSLVMSINSPWGTGKTTFILMWQQKLKNDHIPSVYFNAWKSDYQTDPLLSFIGEINNSIASFNVEKSHKTKAKKYLNKAKNISVEIAKKSIPLAIKVTTSGIIDIDKDTQSEVAEIFSDLSKDYLKKYESLKKNIDSFKMNLQKFVENLCFSETNEKIPFLFFIDELDRCRPDFALELLERIKHIFDIPGIIFVLSVDDRQLLNTIRTTYGAGIDAEDYLRKFIDFGYNLPKSDSKQFCEFLFEKFRIDDILNKRVQASAQKENEQKYIFEVFIELIKMFSLSQRFQEQCLGQINIVLRTIPVNHESYDVFLVFLIVLKMIKNDIYTKFIDGEMIPSKLIEYLEKLDYSNSFFNTFSGYLLEAYLLVSFSESQEFGKIVKTYKEQKDALQLKTENEKYRYTEVVRLIEYFSQFRKFNNLSKIMKRRIEFADKFSF